MEYGRLGQSGLQVSRVVLGCMGFGDPGSGWQGWTIGLEDARPIVRRALEAGITTFDTANVYSHGASEEIVGTLLGELAESRRGGDRHQGLRPDGPGPNGGGLSRGAILTQVDESSAAPRDRLHRPLPDPPLRPRDADRGDPGGAPRPRARRQGPLPWRLVMSTWQFAQAQYLADRHGWTRFVSMQDQYNLLMREEEREMLPFCIDQGVGVLPWSPLARGRLTRDWGTTTAKRSTTRPFGAEDVPPGARSPTGHRRRGRRDRPRTRRLARADRAGLAPPSAGGQRADRRSDPARAPDRRPCGRRAPARGRRACSASRSTTCHTRQRATEVLRSPWWHRVPSGRRKREATAQEPSVETRSVAPGSLRPARMT